MAGKTAAIARRDDLQAIIFTAFEHLDMPIFIKDANLCWVYVNQAACTFLKVPEEHLIGNTLSEVLSEEDAAFIGLHDKQLLKDKDSIVFEWIKIDEQGKEQIQIVKKILFSASDGAQYIIGYFNDVTELRRAEREKNEQAKYYQNLFENTGSSMAIFNQDCVIVKCNAQYEQMSGYSRQEILNKKTWVDFVAPFEVDRLMDYHLRRLDSVDPPPKEYDLDFLTREGELRTFHATVAVIPDTKERVISFLDVTDRKRVERALEESLKKYKALIDTTDTGYVICDYDGYVLDANEEYCRLTGRPSEQVIGRRAREWTLPSEFSVGRQAIDICLEAGKLSQFQTYYLHPDGAVLAIEANATRIASEGKTLFMSLIRDISERKKVEDALRASEERLRKLVDTMPVLIHAYDHNGNVIFWNKECERVLGWTAEELLEMPEKHEQLYAASGYMTKIMRNSNAVAGSYCEWEVPMIAKNGEMRMISWTSRSAETPLPGWHIWETGVDVTERRHYLAKLADLNKHLEELVAERTEALEHQTRALEIANQKLMEVDACKSSFLNTVSHDIRTPLTSILGFMHLIEREFDSFGKILAVHDAAYEKRADRVAENFRIIQEEGARLKRLINDFFELSKIESGNVQWNDRPIDFMDLAERVRSVFSVRCRNTAVDFDMHFSESLPMLVMDQDRLLQILFNILDNAFKFTKHGRIELQVDSQEKDRLHFMISDTGIGMEADVLENIFTEFTRCCEATPWSWKAEAQGSGCRFAA